MLSLRRISILCTMQSSLTSVSATRIASLTTVLKPLLRPASIISLALPITKIRGLVLSRPVHSLLLMIVIRQSNKPSVGAAVHFDLPWLHSQAGIVLVSLVAAGLPAFVA